MRLANRNPRRQFSLFKVVEPHVFAGGKEFQVIRAIVLLIFVVVVNVLISAQGSTDNFRHDESMFQHVLVASSVGMVGGVNQNVTTAIDCSALEVGIVGSDSWGEVALQSRGGVAAKLAILDLGAVLPNLRRPAAPTFTDAARSFLVGWNIARLSSHYPAVMSRNKSRLIVFTSFRGVGNFSFASTFTGLHGLILTEKGV